jgi:hypothetical protein
MAQGGLVFYGLWQDLMRRVPMEYFIVMIEGLIVFAITSLAWRFRRSGSLFLWGILVGMAWCAFLHGLCFGVLRVEGPHADRDPLLLAGFGVVTAFFVGIPLGTVLALTLGIVSRMSERRREMPLRNGGDK